MASHFSSPLVNCEWLHANIQQPNTTILDATFFLPRQQRNAPEEYLKEHIPGALFFDVDRVADLTNSLPHTLPTADTFAAEVGSRGIDNTSQIIVYDNNAFFAAARVWWMFRVFGHNNVQVLDGGLKRWKMLNLPLTSELAPPQQKTFIARHMKDLVCDFTQMKQLVKNNTFQILDARSSESFLHKSPSADNKLILNHIPGSNNVYYGKLRKDTDHTLLANNDLLTLFKQLSIDLQRPIVTTCGSGVSAAVLALSLYQLGIKTIPVYDGSWAEWNTQRYQ